jgi:hypothetical protein
MLKQEDWKGFWTILVTLLRKIEVGDVKTGFAWAAGPDNPIKKLQKNCITTRRISFHEYINI